MLEVSRSLKRTRSFPWPLRPEGDVATDGLPASPGNPKHDEEFWLEDGNIVLFSGDTAFRIYRGLLAAQSSVFADTFTAASSKADETYQGCPVIHLSESPEDLRHFLRVLLPKSHRIFVSDGSQTDVSFEQIFAVVRLSHKYQVDDIFQQAMSLLKKYYTTRPDCLEKTLPFTTTHAIGAANLAVLTETPVILPSALFHCASLGPSVLDGWTRDDGSVEHLSHTDVRRALGARDRLIKESFYGLKEIFGGAPSVHCSNAATCRNQLREILLRAMDLGDLAFEPAGIFEPWNLSEIKSLCTACSKEVRERQDVVVSKLWRNLPGFFGLQVQGWLAAVQG
ncbi:hypothetical protein LXA43DRAFT_325643 [Ganoderma leucocontextum]|nr:hypothetical protein LXA43DRAFT_325643 [Ganoderma leucocontextum]